MSAIGEVNGRRPAPPRPEDLSGNQRARRDRIVQQSYELLRHREYEEIQMRDVAEHAHVALGTLYRYFVSKEHLFAAVLVRWGVALQEQVERAPLSGDDVPQQLRDVYSRVIDAFERLPQFFRLMVAIETTTDSYARELFEEFNEAARSSLTAPLVHLEPEQATAVADVLMAVLGSVLRSWALGRTSVADARERMCRTIDLVFSPPPRRRRTRTPAPG